MIFRVSFQVAFGCAIYYVYMCTLNVLFIGTHTYLLDLPNLMQRVMSDFALCLCWIFTFMTFKYANNEGARF
jgi:hypothetical protein